MSTVRLHSVVVLELLSGPHSVDKPESDPKSLPDDGLARWLDGLEGLDGHFG